MAEDPKEDFEYRLLDFGWRDRLPSPPRPALALFAQDLWQVRLHGTAIDVLPFGKGSPLVGFFTTVIVAAPNRMVAEARAIRRVTKAWENSPPGRMNRGGLDLEVEEVEQLRDRFRWRSGSGYVFYGAAE
jgi:hypothetical protein